MPFRDDLHRRRRYAMEKICNTSYTIPFMPTRTPSCGVVVNSSIRFVRVV
jgi:hypothetical protein